MATSKSGGRAKSPGRAGVPPAAARGGGAGAPGAQVPPPRARVGRARGREKVEPGPPPAEKRAAHRPAYVPSAETRGLVAHFSRYGIGQKHICIAIGISEKTLRRHYGPELLKSALVAEAAVARSLFNKAIGGNVRACEYFLNNRASERWADRVVIADGGVVEAPFDVSSLSDEELNARLAECEKRHRR